MLEEDLTSWWGGTFFKHLFWLAGSVHSWWMEEPGQFTSKTSMDNFVFRYSLLVSHVQGQSD